MERKFHRRPTLSTKPARNLSTLTSQPSFDMFWVDCVNLNLAQKFVLKISQSAWKEKSIQVDSCRRSSSPAPRRPLATRTCSTTPEWTCSSWRRSFPALGDLQPQVRALRVMNVSQNLQAENNSSKKVKNWWFFHFEATADCFARINILTFFTYSHKLQNLSCNLAVFFFLCSLRHRIYRQNKCIQDFTVTLYYTIVFDAEIF
jgi:hypothetical protein